MGYYEDEMTAYYDYLDALACEKLEDVMDFAPDYDDWTWIGCEENDEAA